MSARRLASVIDAEFAELGDQRRADRRAGDRRRARPQLAPLFAATLVNHVAHAETPRAAAYAAGKARVRTGLIVNLRV